MWISLCLLNVIHAGTVLNENTILRRNYPKFAQDLSYILYRYLDPVVNLIIMWITQVFISRFLNTAKNFNCEIRVLQSYSFCNFLRLEASIFRYIFRLSTFLVKSLLFNGIPTRSQPDPALTARLLRGQVASTNFKSIVKGINEVEKRS